MTRIVETVKDIVEKGPDVIDPKIIRVGSIGVVEDVVVPGKSVWVNFGRGAHSIAAPESSLKDVASDIDELMEYFRKEGRLCTTNEDD
jgi:hypothetical protein